MRNNRYLADIGEPATSHDNLESCGSLIKVSDKEKHFVGRPSVNIETNLRNPVFSQSITT